MCCQNYILAPHHTIADFFSGVVADAENQRDAHFVELPTGFPQSNHWEVEWEAEWQAINLHTVDLDINTRCVLWLIQWKHSCMGSLVIPTKSRRAGNAQVWNQYLWVPRFGRLHNSGCLGTLIALRDCCVLALFPVKRLATTK